VPGIGPKRALRLSRELGVAGIADLEAAVRAAGFGDILKLGKSRIL